MKLLMCNKCYDVFSLTKDDKHCNCKEVSGKYIDNINVIYTGDATLIGFRNTEFRSAIRNPGIDFTAFTINPKTCTTFKKHQFTNES